MLQELLDKPRTYELEICTGIIAKKNHCFEPLSVNPLRCLQSPVFYVRPLSTGDQTRVNNTQKDCTHFSTIENSLASLWAAHKTHPFTAGEKHLGTREIKGMFSWVLFQDMRRPCPLPAWGIDRDRPRSLGLTHKSGIFVALLLKEGMPQKNSQLESISFLWSNIWEQKNERTFYRIIFSYNTWISELSSCEETSLNS